MGLSTALYTGLSGLNAASQMISVSGNNIANVNTTAYKSTRADFQTQISQTLRNASSPTENLGGLNPSQIGLGVSLGGISRNFNSGPVQSTGVSTDVALEGSGFFMLSVGGSKMYTRSGNFTFDSNSDLVSVINGGKVQGYGVDDDFNIITGAVDDINIPIGSLTIAEATKEVTFKGNLNSAGEVATTGSITTLSALFSDAAATIPATAADNLNTLYSAAGTLAFTPGDVVTLSGITKGTATLGNTRFEVTDPGTPTLTASDNLDDFGATLQDYLDFMDAALGIENLASEGVSIDASGQLIVEGNSGSANNIIINTANITVNRGLVSPSQPFTVVSQDEALGESVRTSFVSYDSLGNESVVDVTLVLEEKNNSGTLWRYYAQSEDDSDLDRALSTGQLSFDNAGRFVSIIGGDSSINLDHADTGAEGPQAVQLIFASEDLALSALADDSSQISAVKQDGFPIGTLDDFGISADGSIVGIFSNGQLRSLGQIVLATFTNPGGMKEVGGNMFTVSAGSGNATVVTPGKGGTGRTIGGALEGSNVDLSGEFINLISASTGFSASSRVLTTSNQLIQELLSAVR